MQVESVIGRWALVGSASVNGEIAFIGDDPDPNGVSDWLNGLGDELAENIKGTSGLEFEVSPDGRFSERLTGHPNVYWFNVEGVLTEGIFPFSGVLVFSDQHIYLQPNDIPGWSVHAEGRYGKAILRYDDGDTKICDCIHIEGDRLIRTVNIVTDELYTDRVFIVYERQARGTHRQ